MPSNERQPIHPTHVINVAIAGRASRNPGECVTGHILRYMAIPPGRGPALDVPCGTGYGCQILCAKGYDPVGVDRDPRVILAARATYPMCRFEIGDVARFEPASRFAVGACFEGLEHFRDPWAIVRKMPTWADVWYVSVPVQSPNEWHLYEFKDREAIRQMLQAGFKSVEFMATEGGEFAAQPARCVGGADLPVPPMWRCRGAKA